MMAWVTWKEARQRGQCHLVSPARSRPALLFVSPHPGGVSRPTRSVGCTGSGLPDHCPPVILLHVCQRPPLATLSMDLCLLALRPIWWGSGRASGMRAVCGTCWGLALLLTVPSAIYRRLHQEHFTAGCVVDLGGSTVAENSVAASVYFGFLAPLVVGGRLPCALLCVLNARAAHWAWPCN